MSVGADVVVRACRREEVGELLELWAVERSLAASIPDDHAVVERLLDRDEGCVLVAESAGRIVGSLIAAWDGWRGNMYRLAVVGDKRRMASLDGWSRQGKSVCVLTAHDGSLRWWPATMRRPRRSGQLLGTAMIRTSPALPATCDVARAHLTAFGGPGGHA